MDPPPVVGTAVILRLLLLSTLLMGTEVYLFTNAHAEPPIDTAVKAIRTKGFRAGPVHLVLNGKHAAARALLQKLHERSSAEGAGAAYLAHLRKQEVAVWAAEKNTADSTALLVESFPELGPYLMPPLQTELKEETDTTLLESLLRQFARKTISPGDLVFRNRPAGRGQSIPFLMMKKNSGGASIRRTRGGQDTVTLRQGSRSIIIGDIFDQAYSIWEDDTRALIRGSIPVPLDFREGPVDVLFADGTKGRFTVGKGLAPPEVAGVGLNRPIPGQEMDVHILGGPASYSRLFDDPAQAEAAILKNQLPRLAARGVDTRTIKISVPDADQEVQMENTLALTVQLRSGEMSAETTVMESGFGGEDHVRFVIPADFPSGPAEIRARVEDGPWSETHPIEVVEIPAGRVYHDRPGRRIIHGYPGQAVPINRFRGRDLVEAVFLFQESKLVPIEIMGLRKRAIRLPPKISKTAGMLIHMMKIGRVWTSSFDYYDLVQENRPVTPTLHSRGMGYGNNRLSSVSVGDLVPGEIYLASLSSAEKPQPLAPMQADDNGRIRFEIDRNSTMAAPLRDAETAVIRIKAVVGKVEGPETHLLVPAKHAENAGQSTSGWSMSYSTPGQATARTVNRGTIPGDASTIPETATLHRKIAVDLERVTALVVGKGTGRPEHETGLAALLRSAREKWPFLPKGWTLRYVPTPSHTSFTLAAEDESGRLVLVSYAGGAGAGITYYPDLDGGERIAAAPKNIYFADLWRDNTLGHLVADAMRNVSGCSIAVTNALGIRGNIPKGPVTRRHIQRLFPFENTVVKTTLSGKDLLELLSEGATSSRLLHISGCTVTIRDTGPDRIDITLTGGRRVSPNGTYTVATNSYVMGATTSGYDAIRRGKETADMKISIRDAVAAMLIRSYPWIPDERPRWFGSEPRALPHSAEQNQSQSLEKPVPAEKKSRNSKININTAGLEDMMRSLGVDEYQAKMIDAYRYTYGSFKKIEDLKKVPDISDDLFERIKSNLVVDSKTLGAHKK